MASIVHNKTTEYSLLCKWLMGPTIRQMESTNVSVLVVPDLPPKPDSGRATFEWDASATGPIWAYHEQEAWVFALRIDWRDGQFIADELRVFPSGGWEVGSPRWTGGVELAPGIGLTARMLRGFRFGAVYAEARRQLMPPKSGSEDDVIEWHDLILREGSDHEEVADSPPPQRRGRPPLKDEELAMAAYLYDQAIREGARDPVSRVASRLDDPNPDRIRQVIYKCRNRGFLTAAPAPGRPGGELTEKSRQVLQELKRWFSKEES